MASRSRTKNILALATNAQNDKVLRSGKCIDVKMARTKVKKDKPKLLKKADVSYSKTDTETDSDLQMISQCKVNNSLNNKTELKNKTLTNDFEIDTNLQENSVNYLLCNQTDSKNETFPNDTEIDTDLQMISQCKVITSLNNKTELKNKTLTNDFEIDTNLQENSVNYLLCNQTDSKNEMFPNDTEIDTDLQMISQCKVITSLNNKTELMNKTLTNDFDSGTELIDYHVNSSSKSNVTGNETTNKITKERKLSADNSKRYPGLRKANYFEVPEPLFDSDSSISSNYSDSSYNPYKENSNESFSSNDISKSPTTGLIDQQFDFNKEFLCDDGQINQFSVSIIDNNENHSETSKVSQSNIKINNKKAYNISAVIETSKKTALTNKRIWDKKDVCIFCEESVTNFVRHLIRKHSEEIEVAKFTSLKKGSLERKNQINTLRRTGNFFNNISGAPKLIPVRRPNHLTTQPNAMDYLPCKHCFGLFKRKYLCRHAKICRSKKGNDTTKKHKNYQADAQSLLVAFESEDSKLVEEVFPRMAPDKISLVAKCDPLICAFGSRYLKCHKEKHLITVVSNKMRELARFLIAMKEKDEKYQTLQDCLRPEYFDHIIDSTKQIACYDSETDLFRAPSLVLKIGTSLKQCCNIAEYLILKKSSLLKSNDNDELAIKNVKDVENLIEKQWSYELSTNAKKELYQKKWNKPAILPLTSDIKIFRDHLLEVQKNASNTLKKNPTNIDSFKLLQESVLAQLILLNRKRAGEVQRISLNTYLNTPTDTPQEEIKTSLSETEYELTKKFKRIVIRGKRGRGVPILFTPKIQKSINILIALRQNHCNKNNAFLFAIPKTENSCLRASEIIRKMAIESGAKNPSAITSTKLRKQVATVAQLLSFTEGDVEQLSNFMGHSKEVHKTFYRLPENVFQVAKISKFLLMMEKGDADKYRGKNLDEIKINIDTLVSDESVGEETDISCSDDESENQQKETKSIQDQITNIGPTQISIHSSRRDKKIVSNYKSVSNKNGKKKKFDRIQWTDEQKKITTRHFQKHILLRCPPKKGECEAFLEQNETIMSGISWQKVKTFVYNIYKSQ